MGIYILTPEGMETGGPELLHQLGYVLRLLGIEARTVYYDMSTLEPVVAKPVKTYEKYQVQIESDPQIIDQPDNYIVVPEQSLEFLDIFPKAKRIVWWLSVDGYVDFVSLQFHKTRKELFIPGKADHYHLKEDPNMYHLVQSAYAADYVENKLLIPKERIAYLSDYLNDIYLQGQVVENSKKKNMVVFNPRKGFDRLKPIIDKTQGEVVWYPLANMTPIQVRAALNMAKIYIDFGGHPGKDRIPREAAMSGCCVITGKRGSAAYFEDVSIPDTYKFNDEGSDTDKVIAIIKDIFDNFETHYAAFADYRQRILSEQERFITDAMQFFRALP